MLTASSSSHAKKNSKSTLSNPIGRCIRLVSSPNGRVKPHALIAKESLISKTTVEYKMEAFLRLCKGGTTIRN